MHWLHSEMEWPVLRDYHYRPRANWSMWKRIADRNLPLISVKASSWTDFYKYHRYETLPCHYVVFMGPIELQFSRLLSFSCRYSYISTCGSEREWVRVGAGVSRSEREWARIGARMSAKNNRRMTNIVFSPSNKLQCLPAVAAYMTKFYAIRLMMFTCAVSITCTCCWAELKSHEVLAMARGVRVVSYGYLLDLQ